MGVTPALQWLLLALAMQWLLVAANPAAAATTTTTGVPACASTPGGASHTGDRVANIPVTGGAVSEQEGFTANLDAPTANPHVHSAEGRTSLTGAAADGSTSTSDPHALTTGRPSTLDDSPSTTTTTTKSVTRAAKRRAQPVCPAGCECESLEVHCSRAGLVAFPEGLDPRTTYLDVGHNQLTAIADDELDGLGLGRLTSLICDDNVIEHVGEFAFRGLRDLALLQLSGNRIRQLAPFVFVGNTDLRHVDLTGNPLELRRGPILAIQQLEWLDLDQCNISRLALDAFRDMRGLRYLNLSGNRLTRLTLDHFAGLNYLRYVKLSGNPLQCDCDMKPVWQWFRQQTVHVDAKCVSPLNGSTQSWNYLELLECKNRGRH